jgi:alkylhydroperoxidase/carboxymuconolactone decarboxylase family protein YurZ
MPNELPPPVGEFKTAYQEAWQAFTQLGDQCHAAGPLDEKSRRLVRLALAIGAGLEGARHSAARNALAAGVTPAEIEQVAVLATTALGFPATMRALDLDRQ